MYNSNYFSSKISSLIFIKAKIKWLKRIGIFLGRSGAKWLTLGMIGSFLLASAELGIARFLQILLQSLGILPAISVPGLDSQSYTIVAACGILLAIAFLRSLGQFLVYQSSSFTQEILNERLRLCLSAEIIYSTHRPIQNDVHSKLSELFPKGAQFCFFASQAFAAAVQISTLSIVMFVIAPKEALVSLILLSIIGYCTIKINRTVRKIAASLPESHHHLIRNIHEIVQNWLLLKVVKTTDREFRRLADNFSQYSDRAKRSYTLANLAAAGTPFFGVIILIVTIWLSRNVFLTKSIYLLSFLYLFIRFVQLLSGCSSFLGLSSAYTPHFKQSLFYFKKNYRYYIYGLNEIKRPFILKNKEIIEHHPTLSGDIFVKNVDYYYSNKSYLLRNLNFTIKCGQQVGIVGRSGSGKSTLLSLIMGVTQPRQGEIKIGGVTAKSALEDAGIKIGYVGPEPFLFAGTVRENLTYGLDFPSTDNDIVRCLSMVGLDQINADLNHLVEPGGGNFSTGQRQRLCLARALLQKPNLLVLDEASANLDFQTESLITESLRSMKGSTTMIISTHRSQILKYADRIIDLNA